MAKKKKTISSNTSSSTTATTTTINPVVVKMINHFGDVVKLGYTEENWVEASRVLRDISVNVSQETMTELGELWSECYVNNDSIFVDSKLSRALETLILR